MPSVFVAEAFALFTANGTSLGVVTVADTTPFFPGQPCNLLSRTTAILDAGALTAGHLNTVFKTIAKGEPGNSVTLTVTSRAPDAGGVIVTAIGTAVTITYEEGVSTIANLEAAVGAFASLIQVKTAGTGATILAAATDNIPTTSFAGGLTNCFEGMIVQLGPVANTLRVRANRSLGMGANYGYSDVSAFKTADGASITAEAAAVPMEAPSEVVKKDRV